ncbi:unnamed protein product [Sphenostylis stenocarpa]|uniref:Uncharacterized protein n=1 Tax=Sphenostylis stenocarpa TaxID=92480 RepID=A0AA86SA33_9FABA|nr:unnamed protein product [Sphenostylis stenocarpa]
MKAFLIAFLLFASVFIIPTSTLARELNEGSFQTEDPNNPAVKCDTNNGYRSCYATTPPIKSAASPCSDYSHE